MNQTLYDLFGYLAIVFSLAGFLSKTTTSMRINGLFSTSLFALSIYSYGGINGVFVSIISAASKILTTIFGEERMKFSKILSFPIAVIFFIFFNDNGLAGILPALSLIFIIFADIQKNVISMKYIYFGSAGCWLLYGIALQSTPAILFDLLGIAALTYSIHASKKSQN